MSGMGFKQSIEDAQGAQKRPSARRGDSTTTIVVDVEESAVEVVKRRSPQALPTPEDVKVAAGLLSQGVPPVYAAEALGVKLEKMNDWLRRGRDEEDAPEILQSFYTQCHAAALDGKMKPLNLIKMHATTQWQAALKWAQAVDPDTWAPPQQRLKVENEPPPEVPSHIDVDVEDLTPEERQLLRKIQEKRIRAQHVAKARENRKQFGPGS